MLVLVINGGSSSVKYQLINMEDESVVAKGLCERIGGAQGCITHSAKEKKETIDISMPNHKVALSKVINLLSEGQDAVIKEISEIGAISHRVSAGGKIAKESLKVTDETLKTLDVMSNLAPNHIPPQLSVIRACQELFPKQLHVIVFDSSYHLTMPEKAYLYGIPYEYYEKYGIRKYGYHSISFRYIVSRLPQLKGIKNLDGIKMVACHLGSGCSIAAIQDGKSVDTTMGYTPLDGVIMGTRSGSIDPAVVYHLAKYESLSLSEVDTILNKKSGFLGVSGISSDSRDIEEEAEKGNKRAIITNEMFAYQSKKYIGSYIAAMNGIDVLVFSGGLGENSLMTRKRICEDMEYLGIELDEKMNVDKNHMEGKISKDGSRVEIWIVPTNEEITMARDAYDILRFGKAMR